MKAPHRQPPRRTFPVRVWPDRRAAGGQRPVRHGVERRVQAGDRRVGLLTLTCPRCGHVDVMTARSYEGWTDGVLCGLCGPPHVKMNAGPLPMPPS